MNDATERPDVTRDDRQPGGRRAGTSRTREAILAAALSGFAEKGYSETTIRAVARAADVDPALVMHYFKNKEGLLGAVLRTPDPPFGPMAELAGCDLGELGERTIRTYLDLWDGPDTGDRMYALLQAGVSSPCAAGMIKGFMSHEVMKPLADRLGVTELRANLVASQLVGVGMARYVIRIEPLASADTETVVAWIAPTLQRYFAGPLPPGEAPGGTDGEAGEAGEAGGLSGT